MRAPHPHTPTARISSPTTNALSLAFVLACSALCASACSSSAVRGDGLRDEQPQRFPPFQEVELSNFLEAHFLISPTETPPRTIDLALSGDSNLIPSVDLSMIGPRLSASTPDLKRVEPALGVIVEGKLPELHRVSLHDTARATIEAPHGDQLHIDALSESDFSLERTTTDRILIDAHDDAHGSVQGFTKQLTLVASDQANIQTHRLRAQSAVIDLSGKAIATVCVTETLEVRLRDDAILVKFCEPRDLLSNIEEDALLRDPTANEKRAAAAGDARIDIKRKRKKTD